MARISKQEARNKVRRAGISLSRGYYVLRPSEVDRLLEIADEMGYRKPKGAHSSRGVYFVNYLNSNRGG